MLGGTEKIYKKVRIERIKESIETFWFSTVFSIRPSVAEITGTKKNLHTSSEEKYILISDISFVRIKQKKHKNGYLIFYSNRFESLPTEGFQGIQSATDNSRKDTE